MIKTVTAGMRTGSLKIPASKSMAHRQMICAALSGSPCEIMCEGVSKDIEATKNCLLAMKSDENGIKHLFCKESGSTLRFLLPIAAARGDSVVFHMEGRLPKRPHDELIEALRLHGAEIRQEGEYLFCSGRITPGEYEIPGNISSQFISGLLFALPLLDGPSTLRITRGIESLPYILMTEQTIREAGIQFTKGEAEYMIPGNQKYNMEGRYEVERDWSNAAFFLCLGALSEEGVTICDMNPDSMQGDRKIIEILKDFGAEVTECRNGNKSSFSVKKGHMRACEVDATEIPDLVPILSVLAAGIEGDTRIYGAERLHYKESDRLMAIESMLGALGGKTKATKGEIIIHGTGRLIGGPVTVFSDHRIAMAASVAASVCEKDVTIYGAECIEKSYPDFYRDLDQMTIRKH